MSQLKVSSSPMDVVNTKETTNALRAFENPDNSTATIKLQ